MIKLQLSPKEKRVVLKAVNIQLEHLNDIKENNGPEDVLLFCLENDLAVEEVQKKIQVNINTFEYVKEHPDQLLIELDEDHLRIFRHILNTFVKSKKYEKAKKRLWRKLFTYEDLVLKYKPSEN